MSTRSNIVIDYAGWRGPRNVSYLYRHWDGYPAVTGSMVARILRRWARRADLLYCGFGSLVTDLLRHTEGTEPDYRGGGPAYPVELTDSIHGDIEWLYVLSVRGNVIRAGYVNVPIGKDAPPIEAVPLNDIPTFRYMLAGEVRAYRKRVRAYQARQKAATA